MRYFTLSDTHFWHKNIIHYCNRPFKDLYWMNFHLVENWNTIVTDEDTVIFGGDFCYGRDSSPDKGFDILNRLKGNIIMIRGNHDKKEFWKLYQTLTPRVTCLEQKGLWLDCLGKSLWFSHYPEDVERNHVVGTTKYPKIDLHIHGHIHNRPTPDPKTKKNVSVEMTGYKPILVENVVRTHYDMWE